jgi:hypothetical protein
VTSREENLTQFLQKIHPWCDKTLKINLQDHNSSGLRKWNLGVVTSQEKLYEKLHLTLPQLDEGINHLPRGQYQIK